uniref:Uncharacterized protein n=1 Tax=Globodera rostochiensis TaxID=31243 RepID=A0A914HBT5_GLORO
MNSKDFQFPFRSIKSLSQTKSILTDLFAQQFYFCGLSIMSNEQPNLLNNIQQQKVALPSGATTTTATSIANNEIRQDLLDTTGSILPLETPMLIHQQHNQHHQLMLLQQTNASAAVNCRASPFLSSFQNTMPSALSSMPSSVYALSAAPSSHPSYLYHGSDGPPPPPHSSSAALSPTLTPIPQQQLLQSPVIQQMLLMNSNNNSGSITNKTVEIATKMITATNNQFHQQLAPSASASYKPHNQLAQQSPLDSSSPCSSSSSFPQTPHQYAVVPPPPIRLGSPPKPRRKRNMAMCDDGSKNSEHCFETENGGPASIINRINHDKFGPMQNRALHNTRNHPEMEDDRGKGERH